MIPLVLAALLGSAEAADGKYVGLEVLYQMGVAWGGYVEPSVSDKEVALPIGLQGYYAGVIPFASQGPGLKVRAGIEAEIGPTLSKDGFHGRFRATIGLGPALHTDDADFYVLGGVFTGMDTLTSASIVGAGMAGWRIDFGGRVGPVSLDLGIPVGGGTRLLWARALARLGSGFGVGLEFERAHQRNQSNTDDASRLVVLAGVAL